MNRRPTASGSTLLQLLRASEEAWSHHDRDQSIRLLEDAARLAPRDPHIMMHLGHLHSLRYDHALARQYLKKAIRLAGGSEKAFVEAGLVCIQSNRFKAAEHYLKGALDRNSVSVPTLVYLAGACERQRRPEEALELVERAVNLDGNFPMAVLSRARLQRMLGRFAEAEESLRCFFSKSGADNWTRAMGWYELGGVLDRQGRYDEAMDAFLQAKVLLRPAVSRDLAQIQSEQARLAQMGKEISAETLQRWFDLSAQLQPQRRLVVLCGHPRSGTTLLEQLLDSHPGIVSSEETDIFHEDAFLPLARGCPPDASLLSVLESASIQLLLQSRRNYFQVTEKFLCQGVGNRWLLDKNPSLNPFIPAVIRIFPEARFLVAIRDPRDVCLSCFMQPLPINPVSSAYLSLEQTAIQYASVMQFWKTLQPLMKNPSLEVRYEEMVDNLESPSRRVMDFLGLVWDERVLHFTEHSKNKAVRSPTYAEVAKPVFNSAVGRWRHYRKYLEPCLEKLEPFIKAFGYE